MSHGKYFWLFDYDARYGVALLNVLFGSASGAGLLQDAAPAVSAGNGFMQEDGWVEDTATVLKLLNLIVVFCVLQGQPGREDEENEA